MEIKHRKCSRINHPKAYQGVLIQAAKDTHYTRRTFKTATAAEYYAHQLHDRYVRLLAAAPEVSELVPEPAEMGYAERLQEMPTPTID